MVLDKLNLGEGELGGIKLRRPGMGCSLRANTGVDCQDVLFHNKHFVHVLLCFTLIIASSRCLQVIGSAEITSDSRMK